jgi:hypothetical protein
MDDCVDRKITTASKLPKLMCYSYDSNFKLIVVMHVGETSSYCLAVNRMSSEEELLLKEGNSSQ